MKYEFSAGGIVYRKNGPLTEVLVAQHSQHHGWVFPKGFIGDKDKTETKEIAATREVEEETGAKGEIEQALTPVTYHYLLDGVKREKTVYYFIMKYVGGDIAKHDWEMENVEWLPVEQVENRLTYDSDKTVWQEAKKTISKKS